MKQNNRFKITVCFFLVCLTALIRAQDKQDCAINLKEAQSRYMSGKIEEIPGLLAECINSGFTREEKIQAYKLMINAYIFSSNSEQAGEYMFRFLREYPEYEVIATDPNEFTNLMNEFDNRPRYSIGVSVGGNLSAVRYRELIGTYDVTKYKGKYSPGGVGGQGGFMFAKNISSKFEFNAEIQYKYISYKWAVNPDEISTVTAVETQHNIQLPLSVTYTFRPSKFSPYARLGFNSGYMFAATSNFERSMKTVGNIKPAPVSGPGIDQIDKRNPFNFWLILGGGVKYKIPKGYLRADIRYNLCLRNQVNNYSWQDPNSDDIWMYLYRDNKTLRDDIGFNIGYVYTIYHPRKKQK